MKNQAGRAKWDTSLTKYIATSPRKVATSTLQIPCFGELAGTSDWGATDSETKLLELNLGWDRQAFPEAMDVAREEDALVFLEQDGVI